MRKTTSYHLLVLTKDYNKTAEDLVARCPFPVEQTSVYAGVQGKTFFPGEFSPLNEVAGIRFRIPSDDVLAMSLAREIANGRPFKLMTGYGVHQRDIGSQK